MCSARTCTLNCHIGVVPYRYHDGIDARDENKVETAILVTGLRRVCPRLMNAGRHNYTSEIIMCLNMTLRDSLSLKERLSSQAKLTLATSAAIRCASVACGFVA
jgi:hypothetical protein